jgi:Na+-transporting NADH:ubiquinone oxidoreductase subunit A
MVAIRVKQGLDIPMKGRPEGDVQRLPRPKYVSLNLDAFEEVKFRVLVAVGDLVKIGQPLVEDKSVPGRMFASPAGGVIKEIRRGAKRRLTDIVIEVGAQEERHEVAPIEVATASQSEIVEALKAGGLFTHIRARPLNLLANPNHLPRSIFVKACETAPCMPSAEMQVQGHEKEFQTGLQALSKLTSGKVHLVHSFASTFSPFVDAAGVEKHTVEGPHPASNPSIHIHHIDPIKKIEDLVWTLTAHDVVCIGHLLRHGKYHVDKVISISGSGVVPHSNGYFKGRMGYSVKEMIAGRIAAERSRFISGDVLTGTKVDEENFLGFYDYGFSVIPEGINRQLLHFFRPGLDKFSATRAYFASPKKYEAEGYDFTTSQHGEERAFIDGAIYDKVMPLPIPTMLLIKAVLAEDFDTAEMLGLLEVDSEDFGLPAFICPSKVEMVEIIKNAQKTLSREVAGV